MDPYRGRGQMEPYQGDATYPHGGRGHRRSAPAAEHHDPFGYPMGGQMAPFGGRRSHPFAMMDQMMGDMMGGGMFGRMDDMMANMHGGGGMQSMQMFSGGGGGGSFSCQTMTFSSHTGADGKVHTEQFSSSTVGDRERDIRETQQAYSNSSTGMDKMSMERQIAERARKTVKERSRTSGEERTTDMFRRMTEDDTQSFDQQWDREARPYLPQYPQQAALGDYRGQPQRGGYGGQPQRGGYGGQPQLDSAPAADRYHPASRLRQGPRGGYRE